MPPTLRKRPAPAAEPATAPRLAKKGRPAAKKEAVAKKVAPAAPEVKKAAVAPGTGTASSITVGSVLDLDDFGGVVSTHDGRTVTLKSLVGESKAGVIIFTYPKASTPGCESQLPPFLQAEPPNASVNAGTRQVCNFNDNLSDLKNKGFDVYGLSKDSTKSNTTFHDKQKLTYSLLCDPSGTLISAIGLKKEPSGTTRGVFVIEKSGKVLAAQAGSPDSTVSVAKKVLEGRKLYPYSENIRVIIPASKFD
jgi:peroxiredoxin Q/BCP